MPLVSQVAELLHDPGAVGSYPPSRPFRPWPAEFAFETHTFPELRPNHFCRGSDLLNFFLSLDPMSTSSDFVHSPAANIPDCNPTLLAPQGSQCFASSQKKHKARGPPLPPQKKEKKREATKHKGARSHIQVKGIGLGQELCTEQRKSQAKARGRQHTKKRPPVPNSTLRWGRGLGAFFLFVFFWFTSLDCCMGFDH